MENGNTKLALGWKGYDYDERTEQPWEYRHGTFGVIIRRRVGSTQMPYVAYPKNSTYKLCGGFASFDSVRDAAKFCEAHCS